MAVDEIGLGARLMSRFFGVLNQNKAEFARAIAAEHRMSFFYGFGAPLHLEEASIRQRWPENIAKGSASSMPVAR